MIYKAINEAFFLLKKVSENNKNEVQNSVPESITLVWVKNDETQISIDNELVTFQKNQLLFFSPAHQIAFLAPKECLFLQFNYTFFDVISHDANLKCSGLLYETARTFPLISVEKKELDRFQNMWQMLISQNANPEIIKMMLQQLLLLARQLFIEQNNWLRVSEKKRDTLRAFSFFVEQHFKEKQLVADYAALLQKSPKTLSNFFAASGSENPLQIIHNRLLLESKRLLNHPNRSVQSVAKELGFSDLASFSRFFKNKTGCTPSQFQTK